MTISWMPVSSALGQPTQAGFLAAGIGISFAYTPGGGHSVMPDIAGLLLQPAVIYAQ